MFAAALILPQSILLGTTFPLMTAGVLRLSPINPGSRIALLYFLNSIGAAAGVLLAGFVLIPALGLPGTLFSAGLMNVAVALAAYSIAKAGEPTRAPVRVNAAEGGDVPMRRTMMLVAALTGLSSFVYEIIWIRMLSVIVGSSTHSFELMLAAFILGLALGGLWVRKRIDRFRDLIFALAVVQILMGVAAVGTLALYDSMFDFLSWLLGSLQRTGGGYALYNLASHGLALAIMLPATFLAGMTFPLITTALLRGRDGERAIGYVYAANTLGSIVGVILAVHFAMPYLGLKGGIIFGAGIDVVLGIALMCIVSRSVGVQRRIALAAVGVVSLGIVTAYVPVLPERMASGVYRHGRAILDPSRKVVFYEDGKAASITFIRGPQTNAIATNGKPDASISIDPSKPASDEVTMTLTGMLPLAYRPDARTAAVIGFGSGMTTATLLGSPNLERVDTIEIEPKMVEGARLFGKVVELAFTDPRSRIVIDDAKSYFARGSLRYDLILSEPSNPWVSGVASLFTQEFYARVKRQLNPNGIFVQWIQVYEFNDILLSTILRALDAEFPDYTVYAANEGDLIILASNQQLPARLSPEVIGWEGLRDVRERLRLTSLDELKARHIAHRTAIRPMLDTFGGGLNSDYFPLVDQAAPQARFSAQTASGLMRNVTAPVPVVEMLLAGSNEDLRPVDSPVAPSTRRTLIDAGKGSIDFLRTGNATNKGDLPLPREIGLLRAIVWDCASVPPRVDVSQLFLDVAGVVNPMVTPEQASAFWADVKAAKCYARLGEDTKEWITLFEAVGARNAKRMATLGASLAKKDELHDDLRVYALMAAVTGMLDDGNAMQAQSLLAQVGARIPGRMRSDPPMKLLAVLAQGAVAQQASLKP